MYIAIQRSINWTSIVKRGENEELCLSRLGAKPWHAGLDTKPGLGDRTWAWRLGLKTGHETRTLDTKPGHEDHSANQISSI
jgi:hypothetical protein